MERPLTTYAHLLMARREDDRLALVFEGEQWTWRQVVQAAADRATLLSLGQHVGLLLDNVPDYWFWIGAAALSGATVVGINPTRRGSALRADIDHTDVTLLVTERRHAASLEGVPTPTICIEDLELPEGSTPSVQEGVDETTRLLLLFTSGSTGAPKAVVCSTGRLARISVSSAELFGLTQDDVLYQSMPMFHGNALMANIGPATALGARVVLRRTFSASGFLPDVRATGATFFNYVGRALAYVLATPTTANDADNALRLGFGTEASARDADRFGARFGCHLVDSYGSSEGAVVISRTPGTPRGALGLPPPGMDVVVVDPDGAECPRAEFDDSGRLTNSSAAIGEIVNRTGAAAFEGYYNNAEAEAERVAGTWYRSGDLGYRDADGWFWFAGRSCDWLRVDSENFAAAPVESVLARYAPAVMVAVYAVPDARTGDQVMAALELAEGASFDPEHFAAFLQEQEDLGTKWAPRFVRVLTSMPLTATNKVDKKPLRAQQWSASPAEVWWRPAKQLAYEPLSADARDSLRAEFAENERQALLA